MSKLGALVGGLLALSVIAVAVVMWMSLGDVAIGAGGYLALVGGALVTLGLGGGLMALLFYSNRAGYDERAAGPVRPENRPDSVENPPRTD